MPNPTHGVWTALGTSPSELNLEIALTCGQAFRWVRTGKESWAGVLNRCVVELKQTDLDVFFRFPLSETTPEDGKALLRDYFRLDISLKDLYTQWSTDTNFASKVSKQSLAGIRMLRQDPVETTFAFICSSNNNIGRISGMVHALCSEYGDLLGTLPIDPEIQINTKTTKPKSSSSKKPRVASVEKPQTQSTASFYTFPSISRLSQEGVEQRLRQLGFGYRAAFISKSANHITNLGGETYLTSLRTTPYETAHEILTTFPGIGPKVADCICLMSLDMLTAIPIDTHVYQIAKRDYGMVTTAGTKSLTPGVYRSIGDGFRSVFGVYAGWAHTVLFAADLARFKARGVNSVDRVAQAAEPVSVPGNVSVESQVDLSVSTVVGDARGRRKRKRDGETDVAPSSSS